METGRLSFRDVNKMNKIKNDNAVQNIHAGISNKNVLEFIVAITTVTLLLVGKKKKQVWDLRQ